MKAPLIGTPNVPSAAGDLATGGLLRLLRRRPAPLTSRADMAAHEDRAHTSGPGVTLTSSTQAFMAVGPMRQRSPNTPTTHLWLTLLFKAATQTRF